MTQLFVFRLRQSDLCSISLINTRCLQRVHVNFIAQWKREGIVFSAQVALKVRTDRKKVLTHCVIIARSWSLHGQTESAQHQSGLQELFGIQGLGWCFQCHEITY